MNLVMGAAGQVGSAIVKRLLDKNAPTKAVVHTNERADEARRAGAQNVAVADAFDLPALQSAFHDAQTVFVLTPETGRSQDVIGDTRKILANYQAAVEASPFVTKVVGLSSIGAQYAVGNLEMSYLLERAFIRLAAQQVFVRPAYFYSNWLPFLPTVKEQGVLPTFYPPELQIPMASPLDIAAFIAEVMLENVGDSPIYEVEGPEWYDSHAVAAALSESLKRPVEARQMPRNEWGEQLKQTGFTDDAIKNFTAMTDLVIEGKAGPEGRGAILVNTKTTLQQYMADHAR